MNFIKNNLLSNEKLIFFSKMHKIIFALPTIMVVLALFFAIQGGPARFSAHIPFLPFSMRVLLTLICLAVALFTGIDAWISYETSEYGVTNKRILIKTGWIRRNTLELFLDKVEAINVTQSIPGRIFGYGTIRMVGTGGTEDPFFYIPDPLNFRKVAQQQVDSYTKNRT